ncbi:Retrovirus-related Pol polyprotein from transposon 17.6, partial [Mucuna pruriens]
MTESDHFGCGEEGIQVVPKKSGVTVVKNRHDEMATCKDHFPLPFIDQVLENLVKKSHYCFLDGFLGYMQIDIAPMDQHKTTFTCPFGTFAYTRTPFGLCNAPILHRCVDSNLVLNFEKCHFMITEGIVVGHLISSKGIEVDKAKVDVIASLSNPASMWGVRSFLGHFIKIALPLSKLLQKDVDFVFDQPCMDAFQKLKKRLTSKLRMSRPNKSISAQEKLSWPDQFLASRG